MSSLIRKIERQVVESRKVHKIELIENGETVNKLVANPPRKIFYGGRGSKLGVNIPKDKALIARLARETRRK